MIYYKNIVKKLMEERNLTLAELYRTCNVSLNTLRELKNNPTHAFCFHTASQLAQSLECKISDLYVEDTDSLFYDEIFPEMKSNNLFINSQEFSPKNISLLTDLFREVGVECSFNIYGNFFKVTITNKFDCTPITIDLNLLVEMQHGHPVLVVRDFYVNSNKKIMDKNLAKQLMLQQLEVYASKLKIKQLLIYTLGDLEFKSSAFHYSHFHLQTDSIKRNGTPSSIFLNLFYTPKKMMGFSNPYAVWEKNL